MRVEFDGRIGLLVSANGLALAVLAAYLAGFYVEREPAGTLPEAAALLLAHWRRWMTAPGFEPLEVLGYVGMGCAVVGAVAFILACGPGDVLASLAPSSTADPLAPDGSSSSEWRPSIRSLLEPAIALTVVGVLVVVVIALAPDRLSVQLDSLARVDPIRVVLALAIGAGALVAYYYKAKREGR